MDEYFLIVNQRTGWPYLIEGKAAYAFDTENGASKFAETLRGAGVVAIGHSALKLLCYRAGASVIMMQRETGTDAPYMLAPDDRFNKDLKYAGFYLNQEASRCFARITQNGDEAALEELKKNSLIFAAKIVNGEKVHFLTAKADTELAAVCFTDEIEFLKLKQDAMPYLVQLEKAKPLIKNKGIFVNPGSGKGLYLTRATLWEK